MQPRLRASGLVFAWQEKLFEEAAAKVEAEKGRIEARYSSALGNCFAKEDEVRERIRKEIEEKAR